MNNIRNFSIIAHIDHGKSTLADRIIQECGAVSNRELKAQMMDTMEIEQERGITIKAQSVRLSFNKDGKEYILNLIDTPGHVDFSYEVGKSLSSSEGALLIVDASQGVEAQTIANVYIALEKDLEIIPVLNKIDLASANPEEVSKEIEESIGLDCSQALKVSAKSGIGIKDLLYTIIDKIPPPKGLCNAPLKALIYDSWFDTYLGAIALVRVFDGSIKKSSELIIMSTKENHIVIDLLYPHPISPIKTKELKTGEIGIVVMGLKDLKALSVGDTITEKKNPTQKPIEGFSKVKPFVFAGIYTIDSDRFEDLREALDKLKLNDSSISYEAESSTALGFGFRVGFLGMLHMEVIKERLEREFNLDLIATAPSVIYEIKKNNKEIIKIQNPSFMPPSNEIEEIKEPYVRATILSPNEYIGNLINMLNDKRGLQVKMEYIGTNRVILIYDIPMNEIVVDFYDKLKTYTKGYASFDYEPIEYKKGDLVKLDIKVCGDTVDALSLIVPKNKAEQRGRSLCKSLKEIIPRQLFEVAIQATLANKVIARETVKSVGKNVTAKCYGGDITRKRKLLEKQKAGKKRMKSIGKVQLPSEAFLSVLKVDNS